MDLNIENIDQEDIPAYLLKIADRSYEINKLLTQLSRKIRPLQGECQKISDDTYLQVCEETDEKGKLRFSNPRTRETETRRRKDRDSRYLAFHATIEENQGEVEYLRMESNHLVELKEILFLKAGVQQFIDLPPEGDFGLN